MLYFLVYSPPKKQQLYYTTHLSIPHPLLEEPAGSGSLWLPAVWWMSLAGPNWDYHRWFRGFNRPEKEKKTSEIILPWLKIVEDVLRIGNRLGMEILSC